MTDDPIADVTLKGVFGQFLGFKEVRLVPGIYGVAFVEYENEMQAMAARAMLTGATLENGHPLVINYAKK